MLIYKTLGLRPGLVGVSDFRLTKRLPSSRLRWKFPCLPVYMNALDLTRLDHQSASNIQKGSREKELLSQMGSNLMIEKLNDSLEYDTAMDALSSLITRKKRGDKTAVGGKYKKLERMSMYIKILNLEEHISDLKIIHVAGTKGKGSTCTFCEAILRECGLRTGLFTSPHLIDVRERFRLNGLDISEEKFLYYFWECWHQLKKNVNEDLPMPPLFQFLTVLALKIFVSEKVDVAIIEVGLGGLKDSTNVIKDPVVCGVSPLGMDHTESLGDTLGQIASHKAGIFKPQVPAFTVPQLSEAMDVLQDKAKSLKVPLKVVPPLNQKNLNGTQLSLSGDHQFTNAGLAVALCKSWLRSTGNWEKLFRLADLEKDMPEAFIRGLSTARLSGRAQIVYDTCSESSDTSRVNGNSSGDLIFYLDGAHSPESMEACARWFSGTMKQERGPSSKFQTAGEVCNNSNRHLQRGCNDYKISKQILLFNCMDVRDPRILLSTLVNTCASSGTYFSKAIFVPSISTYNKVTSGSSAVPLDIPSKDLAWQFNLKTVWEKIIHEKDALYDNFEMDIPESIETREFIHDDVSNCNPSEGHFKCSAVVSSLPSTIKWLRDYIQENPSFRIQVLVTGSLHLVGDVLKLLQR